MEKGVLPHDPVPTADERFVKEMKLAVDCLKKGMEFRVQKASRDDPSQPNLEVAVATSDDATEKYFVQYVPKHLSAQSSNLDEIGDTTNTASCQSPSQDDVTPVAPPQPEAQYGRDTVKQSGWVPPEHNDTRRDEYEYVTDEEVDTSVVCEDMTRMLKLREDNNKFLRECRKKSRSHSSEAEAVEPCTATAADELIDEDVSTESVASTSDSDVTRSFYISDLHQEEGDVIVEESSDEQEEGN